MKIFKKCDEKVKKLDCLDLKLIKWCVVAWVFFLITVWSWFRDIVISVHWAVWLIIGVALMIRPMMKYYSK